MYACMTPVGFDTSDKFENHCTKRSRLLVRDSVRANLGSDSSLVFELKAEHD